MTIPDPNYAGYSEAAASVFTWLADKVLGGAKKALGWGWERGQWAAAQDRYDEEIIRQYGEVRIFGQTAPKSLKDIFTDVYVLDQPTAFRRFDPAELTRHLWEEDRSLSFRQSERRPGEELLQKGDKFFILGKPGAGKTTFLKYLAVREAQRGRWGACLSKVPIFVSLKQFADTNKRLLDFIVDEFAICHFPDAAVFVEKLLASGKALVLFDGLDEVSRSEEEDRRGRVTEILAQFARKYSGCHIAITCRIAAVDYTFEPAFTYLEMADFAPDQVEKFVHAWFWDDAATDKGVAIAEGMLAEWAQPEHAGLRDLGRNPLLLTLLCLNYAETLSFPVRRVEIYVEALDALLKRWDSSRQIKRGNLYRKVSLGRKQQMFARIAFDGFVQNQVLFAKTDLETRLQTYLAHVPEMQEAIDIDAEAMLYEIIAQHGIFAEQAHRLFTFAHLTFQEYYAARHIADNAALTGLETLLTHISDDKWRDIFLMTASLLPDATAFLGRFEHALRGLTVGNQRIAALLCRVEERATSSHTAYRQSARRVFYLRAVLRHLASSLVDKHILNLDLLISLDNERFYAVDQALALDHALASTLNGAFYLVRKWDHVSNSFNKRSFLDARSELLKLSQQQSRFRLCTAISSLEVPELNAPKSTWQHFAAELKQIIQSEESLEEYHQLQLEAKALAQKSKDLWPLDRGEIKTLVAYLNATRLYYDCLQVAYTSDRRGFEDRIFLPPPKDMTVPG